MSETDLALHTESATRLARGRELSTQMKGRLRVPGWIRQRKGRYSYSGDCLERNAEMPIAAFE